MKYTRYPYNNIMQKYSQSHKDRFMDQTLPEILPEIIESGPLCVTNLFQDKSVAYFDPKWNMYFPIFFEYIFLADPIIYFLCTQKVEKTTPKSCILIRLCNLEDLKLYIDIFNDIGVPRLGTWLIMNKNGLLFPMCSSMTWHRP
jgi:hypothetical protein